MSASDIIALIIFVGLIGLIYVMGIHVAESLRRTKTNGTKSFYRKKYGWYGPADPGQQLNAVIAASFEKQRVLSASEYRAFRVIEEDVASARKGFRVFAQINLGEILKVSSHDAFHAINSKRVDILIIDQGGWPVLAIEHQGKGHYRGTAAARDAVKKEALRKAGVGYVEVFERDNEEQIRSRVREQLGWDVVPTTQPKLSRPATAGRPVET